MWKRHTIFAKTLEKYVCLEKKELV